MKYDFKAIEKKWQQRWEQEGTFYAKEDHTLPKFYPLIEFPYPSGQGLHVGHPRSYTALDLVARKKRMEGYNVLYPIGWDAFGLPAENYAIEHKVHPKTVTEKNIQNFRRQLKALGLSFDWSREVNTTDPEYYKWTQWIFLKLYEKGLAYKANMDINFCTSCKVGLANEEVVNGVCERCGSEVVRREKEQWMLKITEYADRLIQDLDTVDYIERVKIQQKNWIGKSFGADIRFPIEGTREELLVYTTRPDTIYGATYMVISPEHPLITTLREGIENLAEIKVYQEEARKKSDFERTELNKDKTGIQIKGFHARNPISEQLIPIFVSDYVMMSYGTGAIMGVPGHDQRDYDFAKAFGLDIIEVISGGDISKEAYTGDGVLVNSPLINGMKVKEAIETMISHIEDRQLGYKKTNYKLRDWVFSRQRYWGEPIPIIHCEHCGTVPLEEKDLPLILPEVESYETAEDGSSPLAKIEEWVNVTCPKCGGPAKRETDTMPQWAGSSWYFLRYTDPHNHEAFSSQENLDYWLPIDWYNGGMEHTTLHLLYSRFWHKVLYDVGAVPTAEPYAKRTSHGMILGENGEKMSKSRGNVVNPDEIIENFGADTMRLYEMFIGDFEKSVSWTENGVKGAKRFLDRVFKLPQWVRDETGYSEDLEVLIHQTIKKVSHDYEHLKANTAVAQLMTLVNEYYKRKSITRDEMKILLILLNPVAPHVTEEIWEKTGYPDTIAEQKWPQYLEEKTKEDTVELAVQFNGKVRFKIVVERSASGSEIEKMVLAHERFNEFTGGKAVAKVIVIPERLVNIVLK
ncbi:MAG: leucine--tRNA ligase [delta proteobacterium ML8_F1]|nr:MAG: leucine--tRNA ligase [delta proteobacterium ML8_F1]